MSDEKTPIIAPNVANPLPDVLPYAIKAGGLVFVSGSIGFDENSEMVEGGIKEHTVQSLRLRLHHTFPANHDLRHQIIKNLTNVLEAAGSSLDKIVKVNVFIADMNDFGAMNEVYAQYFKKPNLPCRTYVLSAGMLFSCLNGLKQMRGC